MRDSILAINKLDLVAPPTTLPLIAELDQSGLFDEVFIISALTGDGCDDLLQAAARDVLPEGPWLFPEDQLSDLSQRAMAAEITREKLFERAPSGAALQPDRRDRGLDRLGRRPRDPHRPDDLRAARQPEGDRARQGRPPDQGGGPGRARGARDRSWTTRVHLFLFVKVREKWTEDPERYRELGIEFPG